MPVETPQGVPSMDEPGHDEVGAPCAPGGVVVSLDLHRLDAFGQVAWINLAAQAATCVPGPLTLAVDRHALAAGLDRVLDALPSGLRVQEKANIRVPGTEQAFAFVTGSEVFTTKLLTRFGRVHVEPTAPPTRLEPRLHWHAVANESFLRDLATMVACLEEHDAAAMLSSYWASLRPSNRWVSLLTSVFNGDRFLEGFLANSAALDGYVDCEHFLVRAGSAGDEHERLVEHVRTWPGAVYVNLPEDPGLYEVWNLAARLATAPYLSNANLDDRRAPEQVKALADVLEGDGADVASAALRITETANLTWSASADCPVWFATGPDSPYQAHELIRRTKAGYRSRNLPHCMPAWRRSLHAFHGYFREAEFGPSADWEFWLRVGLAGASFARVDRALGLYLRHPASYWRRGEGAPDFDGHIAALYAPPLLEGQPDVRPRLPWGLRFAELEALAGAGAYLELVTRLVACARALHGQGEPGAAGDLVDGFARRYLGLSGLMKWFEADPRGVLRRATSLDGILECLVEVLHAPPAAQGPPRTAVRVLWGAFADLFTLTNDVRALLGCALVLRLQGFAERERRLWQAAHDIERQAFWRGFQDVYRFRVSLDEVSRAVVDGIMTCADVEAPPPATLNLWFYPDFSAGNAYQSLLYEAVGRAGGRVRGLRTLEELAALEPVENRSNILHLHWVHTLFADIDENSPQRFDHRAAAFLDTLGALQRRGIRVYWTVHNKLSHEPVWPDAERRFRRSLCELVDRVYIHHPMVLDELDWLSSRARVHLVEHGPYPPAAGGADGQAAARRQLGLSTDDLVLACIGNIRSYKGLEQYLPVLRDVMQEDGRLKLIVAGRLAAPEARRRLSGLPSGQVLRENRFLPASELATYLRAADYAFLSYRSILTSGSLIHAFSEGVPVIAPALGTLPAYVVNGWNGYTYTSGAALRRLLRLRLRDNRQRHQALAQNARHTAASLRWRFC